MTYIEPYLEEDEKTEEQAPESESPKTGSWFFTGSRAVKFAERWGQVFSVACNEPAQEHLYRRVHVEVFPYGLQLVTTESHILMGAYVSHAEGRDYPSIYDTPSSHFLVADPHHMVKNFMARIARTKERDIPLLTLEIVPMDNQVTFRVVGNVEAVTVGCGPNEIWAHWRTFFDNLRETAVRSMMVDTEMMKSLLRLPKVKNLKVEFTGTASAIKFGLICDREAFSEGIFGLLMPIRMR